MRPLVIKPLSIAPFSLILSSEVLLVTDGFHLVPLNHLFILKFQLLFQLLNLIDLVVV